MGPELVMGILGLVVPPVTDFVKKKFLNKGADTMEATANTLATTNPDTLPAFVEAQAKLVKSRVEWFNRDYRGEVHKWINSLRAGIRPVSVVLGIVVVTGDSIWNWGMDPATRGVLLGNCTSWFSDRFGG